MEYQSNKIDDFDFELYEGKLYDDEDGVFFDKNTNTKDQNNEFIISELKGLREKRRFAESRELINEIDDLIYWYKEHHNVQ